MLTYETRDNLRDFEDEEIISYIEAEGYKVYDKKVELDDFDIEEIIEHLESLAYQVFSDTNDLDDEQIEAIVLDFFELPNHLTNRLKLKDLKELLKSFG